MAGYERVALHRDTEAIQIPDGIPIVLPEGTDVMITQELGGSLTVMTDRGAMFRIDERDVDALGRDGVAAAADDDQDKPLEERVWDQMRRCYDPEIPVNIVDLGLVYDCTLQELAEDRHRVRIQMTLTAPGCGMGPVLAQDVKSRVERLAGVEEAEVEVVLDPPWNPGMMTEAAKLELGFL